MRGELCNCAADTKMRRNWHGATMAVMVPLPSIVFYFSLLNHYNADLAVSPFWTWCLVHPLLLANILFFLNVDLLCWFISLIQTSHWVSAVLLSCVFRLWQRLQTLCRCRLLFLGVVVDVTDSFSPFEADRFVLDCDPGVARSLLRGLSHNYFRRENWQWGAREDWRFTEMRGQYGKHWWWLSFFLVYLSQQVFLIGLCLPFYVIHMVDNPVDVFDIVAMILSLCGIVTAYIADTQLHGFMMKNNQLRELGQPQIPNLEAGLWRYSRHPNYFGEQLWWWGVALLAWNLHGRWFLFVGPFLNSLCFVYSTHLVEQRMLKRQYRANSYRTYQKTTSICIPWFKLNSPKLT